MIVTPSARGGEPPHFEIDVGDVDVGFIQAPGLFLGFGSGSAPGQLSVYIDRTSRYTTGGGTV